MFKDVSEVREFLAWCRNQGIQTVEVGGVKVTFSSLAVAHAASVLRKPEAPRKPAELDEDSDIDPATGYPREVLFASSE